jgi:hypothetical protein
MKTKHWNSNILTFQDNSSFSLVSANKHTGWFLTLGYFLLTVAFVTSYFVIKWLSLSFFLQITFFALILLFLLLNKIIVSIPIGTDCFLYLTNKEFRYQFYHLGYTEVTHPLKSITKISLSSDSRLLKFYLHENRVSESIDIPIKFPKEAARVLQEVYIFLECQGVVLPPPVIIPPKK